MPVYDTFVTRLLRIYHGNATVSPQSTAPLSDYQTKYLCAAGLGPIAFDVYGEALRNSDPGNFATLQSADLTTRVIYRQLETAKAELLAVLQDVGITPVLLKGISTAIEFYSPPHFRLMADIDILVQQAEIDRTMTTLANLGYRISDAAWQKYYEQGHHHLPAARHPQTGATVEVHTQLLPRSEPIADEPVFQPDIIDAQKLEFDVKGIRAFRFKPEYQFIYTIAHWAIDGGWAVNLTSINDTIHIIRRYENELNWSVLAGWLATNPNLYPSVAALTTYLEQSDIFAIPSQLRQMLDNSNVKLQPRTMKTLLSYLHEYPFNAHERSFGDYEIARARLVWRHLTRPNTHDLMIPVAILRARFRYIHAGKYNPLGWLLHLYRYLTARLLPDR